MIKQLTIKNFALIDQLTIEFDQKINVLTGETGAGKSIVIGALRFLLGAKLDPNQRKDPAGPTIVEAVFDIDTAVLESANIALDLDENEYLIVSRKADAGGKIRNEINGSFASLSQLRALGNLLIDFHGQYDHQFLHEVGNHRIVLDRLANFNSLMDEYRLQYQEWVAAAGAFAEIEALRQNRQNEIEKIKKESGEIEGAHLDRYDEAEAESEQLRLENAESISEVTNSLLAICTADDTGISSVLDSAFPLADRLSKIDLEGSKKISEALFQTQTELQNLIDLVGEYAQKAVHDPERLNELRAQIDLVYSLKQKYGLKTENIIDHYQKIHERLHILENIDSEENNLAEKLKEAANRLKSLAGKVTRAREKCAAQLTKTIEKELGDLGMPRTKFSVQIGKTDPGPFGQDVIEFLISPNPGEPLRALEAIVSGGESSRLMLAIKKALTDVDPIPTLTFDEIDANIGGRLAHTVGKKFQEISKKRQMIIITHLPQIASFASHHIKISKSVKSGKTTVFHTTLSPKERIDELAAMMSGEKESDISKRHAREMLKNAK